jgi:hypothetical protein
MSWKKRGSRPRKENWGKPLKHDPKHPKANCHVFIVKGKYWRPYGKMHYYLKEAIGVASAVAKGIKNPNVHVVVKCKRLVVWPNK